MCNVLPFYMEMEEALFCSHSLQSVHLAQNGFFSMTWRGLLPKPVYIVLSKIQYTWKLSDSWLFIPMSFSQRRFSRFGSLFHIHKTINLKVYFSTFFRFRISPRWETVASILPYLNRVRLETSFRMFGIIRELFMKDSHTLENVPPLGATRGLQQGCVGGGGANETTFS